MSEKTRSLSLERYTFDANYVERLVARDDDTEVHFTRYFSELIRIKLRGRIRSSQMIEDIQQETLLRVFRTVRERGIHHPERIGAFVNSVCNNVMLETLRAGSRTYPVPEENFDVRDESAAPDEIVMSEELRQRVRDILDAMSSKDRELLRSVFIEEMDKDEVCRRFDVDREYLRVLLYRARTRMREQLSKWHHVRVLLAFAWAF
jgi:RNA polymerase sigma-70 factor, ECF subfamily